jgi:hypothetical protein
MIDSKEISRYRQSLRQLIQKIDRLSSRSLFNDPLIQGTPAEVFRKCGRPNCKCASSDKHRHGPYKVIQVTRNGRQRQVCLRKDQDDLWDMAKYYQHQIKKLSELKDVCLDLQNTVAKVIKNRLKEFP